MPLRAPLLQAVKVNSLGKWKTALQMVAMSALLLLRNADHILGDEKRGGWSGPVGADVQAVCVSLGKLPCATAVFHTSLRAPWIATLLDMPKDNALLPCCCS